MHPQPVLLFTCSVLRLFPSLLLRARRCSLPFPRLRCPPAASQLRPLHLHQQPRGARQEAHQLRCEEEHEWAAPDLGGVRALSCAAAKRAHRGEERAALVEVVACLPRR